MPLQCDDAGDASPLSELSGAYGQAALILVESILHSLSERSVLSVEDTLATVLSAIEVQAAFVDEGGQDVAEMRKAHVLLERIARTLEIDTEAVGHSSA